MVGKQCFRYMKYFDILKKNLELSKTVGGENYRIAIVSNTTVFEIKDVVEFFLRENKINVKVEIADYNNIVQETYKYSSYDAIIIFWELISLKEGLHSEQFVVNDSMISKITNKTKNEIDLVFKNVSETPVVIFNKFSSLLFDFNPLIESKLHNLSKILNGYLETAKSKNTHLIDTELISAKIGIDKSKDLRKFYTSKSLYSNEFYISYVKEILPVFLSIKGKSKKVLVLDCDNTLWGGILGEDGINGIKINGLSYPGRIFYEVQQILLSLKNQGVLLAICSKNNLSDIEDVFKRHPDFILKSHDFVVKKVNWKDKATNILEISKELNVGVESIVFVDDSKFEVGIVKDVHPSVETFLVPKNLTQYPTEISKLGSLFYKTSYSKEDSLKTKMYLDEKKRENKKKSYRLVEDYLSSLGLEIELFWNENSQVSRAAQLSQKTNQFNLTTKRYTEAQIVKMIRLKSHDVIITSLKDIYGDYGLTGLVIIENSKNHIRKIDSFMLSCRIIGRNIEFALFNEIVNWLKSMKIEKIDSTFIKTNKNLQVENFYENLGFQLTSQSESKKKYELKLKDYSFKKLPYIKVK